MEIKAAFEIGAVLAVVFSNSASELASNRRHRDRGRVQCIRVRVRARI